MCCFSPIATPVGWLARWFAPAPRIHVAETRIFARVEAGIQHLVYSMSVTTPADVAMVLPLPVVPLAGESALSFVDLSGYSKFFSDLDAIVTPQVVAALPKGGWSGWGSAPRPRLIVHDVGAFEASFVPTIADFDRLDPRFRLPDAVFSEHPEYSDFGFAVFKLRKGRKQLVHPMAMSFPARDADAIFFPTLHVHDGQVHETASFDHELYYQAAEGTEPRHDRPDVDPAVRAMHSFGPARQGMNIDLARGLVAPDQHVYKWTLRGRLANCDTRVLVAREPRGAREAA